MSGIRGRIEAAFTEAGVTGCLHATDLDGPGQLAVRADAPVCLASVFKVPLLVAWHRSALDPAEQITLRPGERTGGPTGIGAMQDPITLSLRDLAYLAIAVSDNAAADALLDRIGLPALNDTLAGLGLTATTIRHYGRDLQATMAEDAGGPDPALLADPAVLARLRVLDPARTNSSTAREMTRLLALIWRDETPGAALLRRAMGLQVWPHRLSSGFPFDDVRVAGKTGTLPTVRNEIGVVEYPDGGRYAVAVFTRSASTAFALPAADAVIGTTARLAIDHLRAHR
ncbi:MULTISPECIES: serine hydrolase [unclassified Crossiella]|uniref:serine hydrolase n=1 Tax=unclassified Crossiella TaxID=2620835 RepID=UPI00200017AD|nr:MULTISPECIES: serine hydrolase [unclassified Crossiella]MCK2242728.1 class A beta-lactamase-related serine hydrolase [Crossiella sp. S99.2]MCK2256605.1 class A beta-lactamase-related serine hydrolase [Crossiella sp. S99.1]